MRHSTRIPLRWGDLDALGHVNNVEYLRYLEEARVRFLADLGVIESPGELGVLAARHEIDYLAPMLYRREPVIVEIGVQRIGRSSFALACEVRDEATLYAHAVTVIVVIDPATGRSTPIPDPARAALRQYVG